MLEEHIVFVFAPFAESTRFAEKKNREKENHV